MARLTRWLFLLLILAPAACLLGERVQDLPAPTGYVSDFAHVLSSDTLRNIEDLCTEVDRQAHAQIAVVTIQSLDAGDTVDTFATALEDKWKVGTKGTDRGVLMVFVMSPTRGRIEIGYGLEGILNDAKVGDIGRAMAPYAQQGDYNQAIPLGVQKIAQVIATDAGVTLTQIVHQYHRQGSQAAAPLSLTRMILGGLAILFVLFFLVRAGPSGWLWFLLGNIMGGGGRWGGGGGSGGGDSGNDGGGGFGGFDGGGSGGGGASGDW